MPRTIPGILFRGFSRWAFRGRAGLFRGCRLFGFESGIARGGFFDVAAAVTRDFREKFIADDGTWLFDGDVFRGSVLIAMLDQQPRFSGAAAPAVGAYQHPRAF